MSKTHKMPVSENEMETTNCLFHLCFFSMKGRVPPGEADPISVETLTKRKEGIKVFMRESQRSQRDKAG